MSTINSSMYRFLKYVFNLPRSSFNFYSLLFPLNSCLSFIKVELLWTYERYPIFEFRQNLPSIPQVLTYTVSSPTPSRFATMHGLQLIPDASCFKNLVVLL